MLLQTTPCALHGHDNPTSASVQLQHWSRPRRAVLACRGLQRVHRCAEEAGGPAPQQTNTSDPRERVKVPKQEFIPNTHTGCGE